MRLSLKRADPVDEVSNPDDYGHQPNLKGEPARNVGRKAGEKMRWMRNMRRAGPSDRMTRLVLYTIASYMDGEGHAFPSFPTIAKGAAMSVRTAKKYVAKAVKSGWLVRDHSVSGNGQFWNNLYDAAYPPGFVPTDA